MPGHGITKADGGSRRCELPLTCANRHSQPIRPRRKGAVPARVISARWVVGVVEVEDYPSTRVTLYLTLRIAFPFALFVQSKEIAPLHLIEQVATAPMAFLSTARISKRQNQPTPVPV